MNNGGKLDVGAWLNAHGIGWRDGGRTDDGRKKYILDHCPFNPDHDGKDAAIFQSDDGQLGFHCFHNSCSDKHWAECREAIMQGSPHKMLDFVQEPSSNGSRYGGRYMGGGRPEAPPYKPDRVNGDQLLGMSFDTQYLCKNTVRLGPPLLIGGPSKSLKTSIILDLLVSIASGTNFLGSEDFPCERAPVYFVSGEIDAGGIKDKYQAICDTRVTCPFSSPGENIYFSFVLPRMSCREHLEIVKQEIVETKAKLFVLDPAYLALLSAENAGDASNLFTMGSVLREFAELSHDTGCTMALIHHLRKAPAQGRNGAFVPPVLADFAYSGFAEFARQWILIGRRERYRAGSGRHSLYICTGGSGGHGWEAAVSVDEGDDALNARRWVVDVTDWDQAEAEEGAKKANAKMDEWLVKRQRVIEAIANGATSTYRIRQLLPMSGSAVSEIVEDLVSSGEVSKTNGQLEIIKN